ncbi:hypothetical protein G6F50_013442 [Rhizopus delemar]|uniref:Uncharacterized protein n=1 Tax=Rhizopus delemar TaxID=936053 RepID=A0A9P7CDQ4_9FUNG|nr:hypothetical protein G6F50_013442 [Rhizopus delemar]
MAGVQPAADRAALAAGVRLAVQRVRQQAGGHRHRQPQHLQLPVHLVGPAAALAAAQFPQRGGQGGTEHHRHAGAPVVEPVRARGQHRYLRAGDGRLFGGAGLLRAVRRWQVDHRGAVRDAGRQRTEGAPGLGGTGLQRGRSAAEPDQSVLDAAAAGRPRPESTRHRRLHLHPAAGAHPAGAGPAVAAGHDPGVCAAGDALNPARVSLQQGTPATFSARSGPRQP